eukprot:1158035-Pelagomonas_calceolata.AAC.5
MSRTRPMKPLCVSATMMRWVQRHPNIAGGAFERGSRVLSYRLDARLQAATLSLQQQPLNKAQLCSSELLQNAARRCNPFSSSGSVRKLHEP